MSYSIQLNTGQYALWPLPTFLDESNKCHYRIIVLSISFGWFTLFWKQRKLLIKMGKIFLDHIGGTRLFSCAACDVNLTNRAELISTRFTGATGIFIFTFLLLSWNWSLRNLLYTCVLTFYYIFSDILWFLVVKTCTIVFLGRAFLFHKVVNLVYSEVQDRVMLTGRHMVRDVSCKNCATKLGWVYEFATEENQR